MQKSLHISICLFNDLFFLLFTLKILYMYVHYLVYVLCSSYIYIFIFIYIHNTDIYIYKLVGYLCFILFVTSHPISGLSARGGGCLAFSTPRRSPREALGGGDEDAPVGWGKLWFSLENAGKYQENAELMWF
jgi:hypothetical protein